MSAKRFEEPIPRRDFLGKAALASVGLSSATALVGVMRLPKPAVLPESASRFKVGFPDDFPPDSHRLIENKFIWIYRDQLGFYAVSSICPHLGCIVKEEAGEQSFICPCHGSRFDASGNVLGGPSPRGLDWLDISLAADGELMVDTAQTVSAGTRFNV